MAKVKQNKDNGSPEEINLQGMIAKVQAELTKKNKQDIQHCADEIAAALQKYDCRLEPVFVFTSKGMLPPQINIEKNPQTMKPDHQNGGVSGQ